MKKCRGLCMAAIGALLLVFSGVRTEAVGTPDKQVTAVEVPQNLNFYLDPENENGRGQIYSKKYKIRNAGKEPMTFSMEVTLSVLDEAASIAFCPEEWEKEPADRSIYMYVAFEDSQGETQYALTDAENPCKESIVLQPAGTEGDSFFISFGGMLSRSEEWKSGELAIHSIYAMSADNTEYPVEIAGEHIRIEKAKTTGEEKLELYLVPEEGYFLPAKIQVSIEDSEVEASYDAATGKVVLENVTGKTVIDANGITKAGLPDAEVMDAEKGIWTWTAEEGIQAYEYTFLRGEEAVKRGRVSVGEGTVNWNWSEELEDGDYLLNLKAIGDAVHCLNSEEAGYPITLNRELLQTPENAEEEGVEDNGDAPSSEEQKKGDEASSGDGDASLREEQEEGDALSEQQKGSDG